VDSAGNVYVADSFNDVIRKITPAGVSSTLAGTAGAFGSANGTGAAAQFNFPVAVAVDASGNVYVADGFNNTIRKVTAAGVVTTLAGTPGVTGSADGTGAAAQFNLPQGVAVDASGNVYVSDGGNSTIRRITAAGVVTTLAGVAGTPGGLDGTGPTAEFNTPYGIAVDASGNLYVADSLNGTLRKGSLPPVAPTITAQPQSATVTAGAAASFSVTATGTATLTYQWLFNGAAIAGATSSSFSIATTAAANAGSYTVTVSNAGGSVTSTAAVLTVNAAAATTTTTTTTTTTAAAPAPASSGGGGAPSLWFYAALLLAVGARQASRRQKKLLA
jgi:sugar lactone lactonase YvrE